MPSDHETLVVCAYALWSLDSDTNKNDITFLFTLYVPTHIKQQMKLRLKQKSNNRMKILNYHNYYINRFYL